MTDWTDAPAPQGLLTDGEQALSRFTASRPLAPAQKHPRFRTLRRDPPIMPNATGAILARKWLESTDPAELSSLYAGLHEAGPLLPAQWGALLVPGYQDVRGALANRSLAMLDGTWRDQHAHGWRTSASTVAMCQTFLQQNPPEHTRSRRPVASAISALSMIRQAPAVSETVDQEVGRFAARLREQGTADIAAELCLELPALVIGRLAGLRPADAPRIARLAHRVSRSGDILRPREELLDADSAASEILVLIDEALGRPSGGFLARWSGDPAESVRLRLFALLNAGIVTSTALLANLCEALLTRPVDRDLLIADPRCRQGLIEETMRWDPPVKVATRRAVTPTEVAGTVIDEGQIVHLLIGAAHQDPAVYSQPGSFDPGRPFDRNFVFGTGIHFCPGASLARAQAEAFVPAFLRHLGQARAVDVPVRRTGPSFTDMTSLPVESGAPGG